MALSQFVWSSVLSFNVCYLNFILVISLGITVPFYPRDAVLSTGIATAIPSVCVCLCVKCVLCIKTDKHFIVILLPPDSTVIQVFLCQIFC